MPKSDKPESPLQDAGVPDADAGTPGASEGSQDAGELSTAGEILAEAESAVADELAEVREELSEVGQAVMSWLNDHGFNTPISRATEALNYLREHAVPDLIKRIERI